MTITNVLVRCELCGAYDLAPAECSICVDCARLAIRTRAEAESQGGRVLVIDGELRIYSAEDVATPEGELAYWSDIRRVTSRRPEPVAHLGEA